MPLLSTSNVVQVYIVQYKGKKTPSMVKYSLMTGETVEFTPPPTKVSCKHQQALPFFVWGMQFSKKIFVLLFFM